VDDHSKLIIFSPSGLIQNEELAEIGKACRKEAEELGYGFLIDFRKSQLCAGIVTAEKWFESFFTSDEMRLKKICTAYIAPESMRNVFTYVDDTWHKKGINTRVFSDMRTAKKWLKDQA